MNAEGNQTDKFANQSDIRHIGDMMNHERNDVSSLRAHSSDDLFQKVVNPSDIEDCMMSRVGTDRNDRGSGKVDSTSSPSPSQNGGYSGADMDGGWIPSVGSTAIMKHDNITTPQGKSLEASSTGDIHLEAQLFDGSHRAESSDSSSLTPADLVVARASNGSARHIPRCPDDRYEWREAKSCRLHPFYYTPFYQPYPRPWNEPEPDESQVEHSFGDEYSQRLSPPRTSQPIPIMLLASGNSVQGGRSKLTTRRPSKCHGEELSPADDTMTEQALTKMGGQKPALDLTFRSFKKKTSDWKARCRCKHTRCLKLYCICFENGVECRSECKCDSCLNTTSSFVEVQRARASIMAKNPQAFENKIEDDISPMSPGRTKLHKRGCKCSKSSCLKKYCECYGGSVYCGSRCQCRDCLNFPSSNNTKRSLPDANHRADKQRLTVASFKKSAPKPHKGQGLAFNESSSQTKYSKMPHAVSSTTDSTLKRKRAPSIKAVRAEYTSYIPVTESSQRKKSPISTKNLSPKVSPALSSNKKAKSSYFISPESRMQAIDYMNAYGHSSPSSLAAGKHSVVFPIDRRKLVKQKHIGPAGNRRKKGSFFNKIVTPTTGKGAMVDYYFVLHYDEELSCITLVPLTLRGEFRRTGQSRYVCDFRETSSNWIVNTPTKKYTVVECFKMVQRQASLMSEAWIKEE